MIIETPTNWIELMTVMMMTEAVGLLNQACFWKPSAVITVFKAPCWYWKMK